MPISITPSSGADSWRRQVVSSGGIASLTSEQQAIVETGTIVTTIDGRRWTYKGEGSKTSEASYVELADVTPVWSVIADKPSSFPPESHTHVAASITDFTSAVQAASVYSAGGGTASIVGSGASNTAIGNYSVVGGGQNNTASGLFASVAGGYGNTSTTGAAASGVSNVASGAGSVVGGALAGDFTVTIASPAVFTLSRHRLAANDAVRFSTTGELPTGISPNTTYYVISNGLTTDSFRVSATLGGSAINTSGTQSGTHTLWCLTANNTASGRSAAVVGGVKNTASGIQSFVGGGQNNTASGVTATVGGGRLNAASAINCTVGGGLQNAANINSSTVSGGQGNTASGHYSTVGGGYFNTASGSNSTIAGGGRKVSTDILGNTASGVCSAILGGIGNTASGYYANVCGGQGNNASARFSVVLGGQYNTSSGEYGAVLGGASNTASALFGTASGYKAVADRLGMRAFASGSFVGVAGSAQCVEFVLFRSTLDATPTPLRLDGATPSSRLTIPSGKALFATITIAGIINGGSKAAHYVRKVAIKNVGGTTSLIGTVSTVGTDVEDDAAYDVAITADNTNDALVITVTGKASEIIRWVAHVEGVEIAYG